MTVLGIETSCDETSIAIVSDGKLLSNVVASQHFHTRYGGIVPELASRAHQRLIVPVLDEALAKAGCTPSELEGVAAVHGPGLIGSLLVGLSFAKAYAFGLKLPFVGINHMEAHIFSNLIDQPRPQFPFMNLTVSGGHTQLVLVKDLFEYELLGETLDDAAGEAFDKVAKMLGLGYPGGPEIDSLAREGKADAIRFPRPFLTDESYNFSFSGLKTSVLYYLKKAGIPTGGPEGRARLRDIAASFQQAVVDVLVGKTMRAALERNVRAVAVAGGVAANSGLRSAFAESTGRHGLGLFVPRKEFCTDNGAMVALAGHEKLVRGLASHFELAARPNLELT
jgi:N6-L-threonylcarbamoyladenine synthase